MRLKDIKPGMVVHVKNGDEYKELLKEAKRLGYRWLNGNDIGEENFIESCEFVSFNKKNETHDFMSIGLRFSDYNAIEFSTLVLPELTAEEAIEWMSTHYSDGEYVEAFGEEYTMGNILDDLTPNEIVKCIEQWKQEHEKKEPEIETVDICRIIEVFPDCRKRCVHEEEIIRDVPNKTVMECVREILKQYRMEHDGEFIAVHETVCRVKR